MAPSAVDLESLLHLIGGAIEGDGAPLSFYGVATLQEAGPRDLAVLFDSRAKATAQATKAGLLVCAEDVDLAVGKLGLPLLRVSDPALAFVRILQRFYPEGEGPTGIHPSAIVSPSALVAPDASVGALSVLEVNAEVGEGSRIGPQCTVGEGVRIGRSCRIGPGVRLLRGTRLGDGVLIGAGTVIGERGFGYLAPDTNGWREPIPQVGGVLIEDGVHVGALCAVDRGTLGDTRIGPHARLDNLIQLGHNAQVLAGAVLVAQVGVAGSAEVGRGAVLAGQSGVANHRRIGDGAVLAARAAAFRDVPAGQRYSGTPARPHRQWLRERAQLSRLARRQEDKDDGVDR